MRVTSFIARVGVRWRGSRACVCVCSESGISHAADVSRAMLCIAFECMSSRVSHESALLRLYKCFSYAREERVGTTCGRPACLLEMKSMTAAEW